MPFERTTQTVHSALVTVFAEVDIRFDYPDDVRTFQPSSGGWTIDQILEHISLTNHYLMLTLKKWVATAEKRAARGDPIPEGESDLQKVDIIGERGSFSWIRPDHMEPTGELSSKEVRETLHRQRDECLVLLERIRAGVGALCHIKMTVNDLGKIDLYQWLYFLVQHAHRHLQQMAEIEKEFSAESPQSG